MALTYKDAGVDIRAGDELVERIKGPAARTHRPGVLGGIGGFAALFSVKEAIAADEQTGGPLAGITDPVLVSGTDGVGTKVKLAALANKHDTIGIDLVAMCVNDVITCGATPLFFLDYFATAKLDPDVAQVVIEGIAAGCREACCALVGGETAEMPGLYAPGDYDMAGFCVGVVDRSKIIDGSRVEPGDVLIGIASSGIHSNGLSLARKALLEVAKLPLDAGLAAELLAPTAIYVRTVQRLCAAVDVHALAHVTGSGIPGNLPRVLPHDTRAVIERGSWTRPAIFDRIQKAGNVPEAEMIDTFNLGIGMIAVVAHEDAGLALASITSTGFTAWQIGEVQQTRGEPTVVFED